MKKSVINEGIREAFKAIAATTYKEEDHRTREWMRREEQDAHHVWTSRGLQIRKWALAKLRRALGKDWDVHINDSATSLVWENGNPWTREDESPRIIDKRSIVELRISICAARGSSYLGPVFKFTTGADGPEATAADLVKAVAWIKTMPEFTGSRR